MTNFSNRSKFAKNCFLGETEYRNISKYIIENPTKWEESEQTP